MTLQHCVFLSFEAHHSAEARADVLSSLEAIKSALPGMLGYTFGPNRDYEQKSQGFSDGFIVTFKDRAALADYAAHPLHQAFGAKLVSMCNGGADGIMVFDLEVNGAG